MDFEPPPDGVVRWAASQSPNPALQALMKEAEREKKTRPSSPAHEPTSWTYPLASTPASVPSPWHSGGRNSPDVLPLSASCASSSLPSRVSQPFLSRRAKPHPAVQRKPLASSISSMIPPSSSSGKQPLHNSARLRSSSTTPSDQSTKPKYVPHEEEPEAMAFIELLKDVSRQLDQNAEKKQRLVARTKDKERDRSPKRNGIDSRTGLHTNKLCARPLTKTSSASAICPIGSSTTFSTPVFKPELRGRILAKTASLGPPVANLASPPHPNLQYDHKLAPVRIYNTSNTHPAAACKTNTPNPMSHDSDSAMHDVIDLTDTDTEWERPISGPISHTDTAVDMQVDDDDMHSDAGMDVSFFNAEPPPQIPVAAPKPTPRLPQSNTASRLPTQTQRARTGPPPLGMCRAPQLQTFQYGSVQGSKGVTASRFRPPLLTNGGGTANKSRSGTKPTTMTSSKPPLRGGATKVAVTEMVARNNRDADSSFDVSFDVDADALEEAMKAYD